MKKVTIVIVALCVAFIAWKTFSTLPAQGYWHASLETGERNVAFDYRIVPLRGGMSAWVSVPGVPDRSMDNLDLHHSRVRFDLPVAGKVYHLDGMVVKRKIDGTWRLDDGTTGMWHAQRYSLKRH